MGHKANGCGIFGFILTLITLGLFGASLGTTHWRTPGSTSLTSIITLQTAGSSYGLFENCITVNGIRTCTLIGWSPDEAGIVVTATRGVLLLGAILVLIGVLVGIAALCGSANIKAQGGLNLMGGFTVLVACAAYIAMTVLVSKEVNNPPTATDYGYSHYLCWASGGLFIIAGIFGVNGASKNSGNEVHPGTMQAQMVWATRTQPGAAPITQNGQHQLALIKA